MAKKTKNVFLNWVSEKLIHANCTANGERQFANVSIPLESSVSGYGSFAVNLGQILQATRKDGTAVDGMKNILLGEEGKSRKVSIQTEDGYELVDMTNGEIVAAVAESRKAYRAAQAGAEA